jgi:DNA polymerase-3 subunit epsilon
MKKIYIDTETTGLNPAQNSIHQLAMLFEQDGQIIIQKEFFIKPYKKVDEKAVEISGKTIQELNEYPNHLDVYPEIVNTLESFINKFNKKDKAFLLGYNVKFDADFMRNLFSDCGDKYFGSWFWNPPIDIMSLACEYLIEDRESLENFKLPTVCSKLGIDINPHDAMSDILATRELYLKIRSKE